MYPPTSDLDFVATLIEGYFARLRSTIATAPHDASAELLAEFTFAPALIDTRPLQSLELTLPAPLPLSFRAYLSCGYFPGIEASDFYLPSVDPTDPIAQARLRLLERSLWPFKLLQFAHGPCGDPLCFDLSQPTCRGEFQIAVINHDLTPHSAWRSRVALEPYIKVVAPSFRQFLASLCTTGEPPWTTGAAA